MYVAADDGIPDTEHIATAIKDVRADYPLAVKANQPQAARRS